MENGINSKYTGFIIFASGLILGTLLFSGTTDSGHRDVNSVPSCEKTLSHLALEGKIVDPLVQWRASNTYPNSQGATFPTDAAREAEMKERQDDDIESVTNQMFTPGIAFYPMTGVVAKNVTPEGSYLERVEVSGEAVKDGILRGSMLLPVSGHRGKEMADAWKSTDRYSVWVTDSKGNTVYLAKDALSLDYLTIMELEIPLEKDQMISVYYARVGSAGVWGYPDGRTRQFIWK